MLILLGLRHASLIIKKIYINEYEVRRPPLNPPRTSGSKIIFPAITRFAGLRKDNIMQKVHIVDEMMGVGKTSAAINLINESSRDSKFLFITPYLDEVERVLAGCQYKDFKQPPPIHGSKITGIKDLLRVGENIATTHALFYNFDAECLELIESYGYTLIIDEILDVVEQLDISRHDLNTILAKYTVIENGFLRWVDREYTGVFDKYKTKCDLGCMCVYNDTALLWMFPTSVFKSFREVYLMTYLFGGQVQKAYFDFNNVEYDYLYVDDTYHLSENKQHHTHLDYKQIVTILDVEKLNRIGDAKSALSFTWYERYKDNAIMMRTLKNNTMNFFKHYAKTPSAQNMWTTFLANKSAISGKGYAHGFKEYNLRSTNKLRDKTAIAYLVNRFLNPFVKNFFMEYDIEFNEDMYALSEMIQFIWRSAIRDGKPIQVYVPSMRMRNLLTEWLNELPKE